MKPKSAPTFRPKAEDWLPEQDSWPRVNHIYDPKANLAVQAALSCQRPLLIRGEAGIGKSQIARAAAHALKWPFLSTVVNGRTEPEDLLFSYDAVARLAQAHQPGSTKQDLAVKRFIKPGPFWWALNWTDARKQAREYAQACIGKIKDGSDPLEPKTTHPATTATGCVLLIDEIDKAEADLPNALLESLGNNGFQVPPLGRSVRPDPRAIAPLVIFTTNEDRELPPAFVRRCLVLNLALEKDSKKFADLLVARAQSRLNQKKPEINAERLRKWAIELHDERGADAIPGVWIPGAAEYLDLVQVIVDRHPGDDQQQDKLFKEIWKFGFKKNRDA